ISEADAPKPTTNPLFHRYTDAELAEIAKAPEPAQKLNITSIDELKIPRAEEDARKYFQSLPTALVDQYFDAREGLRAEEGKFFHDEGALALIRADARAHNGLLFAEAAGSHESKDVLAPATFVVTEEQYSRMVRLLEKKHPVSMRLDLEAKVSDQDVDGLNLTGEIPGQKKPDEIVMIGAHFDSWHTG